MGRARMSLAARARFILVFLFALVLGVMLLPTDPPRADVRSSPGSPQTPSGALPDNDGELAEQLFGGLGSCPDGVVIGRSEWEDFSAVANDRISNPDAMNASGLEPVIRPIDSLLVWIPGADAPEGMIFVQECVEGEGGNLLDAGTGGSFIPEANAQSAQGSQP